MTKIKLNLQELLTQALGGESAHIPASVDVSELLDFHDAYECEQDLDDLLYENRLIAHIWGVEDVRSVRPDLTDDQAWEVLQRVERDLDSSVGVDWETIEQAAEELHGSGDSRRIERFGLALASYNDDLPQSNLIDFMADAMHWCQVKGCDFDEKLEMARAHFNAENSND